MAKNIIDFEARRDGKGHLAVYNLPSNDGGGRYEVAGINERYDGPAVRKLVALLGQHRYDEAEEYAQEYIAQNTDSAATLTNIPMIESYLRDCVFNRGGRGTIKILQLALHVGVDGYMGPKTKAAMAEAEKNPKLLLKKLRDAREEYERDYVGYRSNFWHGLVNRWNKAEEVALNYPDSAPMTLAAAIDSSSGARAMTGQVDLDQYGGYTGVATNFSSGGLVGRPPAKDE